MPTPTAYALFFIALIFTSGDLFSAAKVGNKIDHACVNKWKNPNTPLPVFAQKLHPFAGPRDAKTLYKQLAAFPQDIDKLKWPKENPWVKTKGVKPVKASSFGWDKDDATKCLQKALDSNAKVILIDKMKGPWHITGVVMRSGKTVILDDGVVITGTIKSRRENSRQRLFQFDKCEKIFVEGKGKNYIGRYTEEDELGRNVGRKYGSTAIGISDSRDLAFKNLYIANNGEDGVSIGGILPTSQNIWFEDVVLHRNTRQGMSICSGMGIYMKNVTFSGTCGLPPKCGLDIEPSLPTVEVTSEIYLLGCTFKNNDGAGVQFSTSSRFPITFYAKDCVFEPTFPPALGITQRVMYPQYNTDAPSDIIFENCLFKTYPGVTPIQFAHGNFFHVTFKGGEIRELKGMQKPSKAPMKFSLKREFRMEKDNSPVPRPVPEGSLVFDNLKITGFEGKDAIEVEDMALQNSVNNIYGIIVMNKRKLDVSKYRYIGYDAMQVEKTKVESSKRRRRNR